MAKIILNDVNLELSPAAATEALNANWAAIEEFCETVLSRDGTSPNQMEVNLDMNGKSIINHLTEFGDGVIRAVEQQGTPANTQTLVKDLVFVGATVSSDGSRRAKITITVTADLVEYDNDTSGLAATTIQEAIDEVVVDVAGALAAAAAAQADADAAQTDATQALADAAAAQSDADAALAGLTAGATVVTEGTASRTALPAHAGNYTRFTSTSAKTYTFSNAQSYVTGTEFHGRNAAAENLTIVGTGVTINAPAGGTLVVPPHGTFTVKIVATNVADLFGVTVPA